MKTFFLSFLFHFLALISVAQTILEGKVTDSKTGEVLIGANVIASQNGRFVAGGSTDLDGKFTIGLPPGSCDIKVSFVGYPDEVIENIKISPQEKKVLNVALSQGIALEEVVIIAEKPITKECKIICILQTTNCFVYSTPEKREAKPIEKKLNADFDNILRIYPNPAVDHTFLHLEESLDRISLISLTGRKLKTITNPESGQIRLDLSGLLAGPYFVQFQSGKAISAKSLIVAKP